MKAAGVILAAVAAVALALCAAAGEEAGDGLERYFSPGGVKALEALRSPFALDPGVYTLREVEGKLAEKGLRFSHSALAAAMADVRFTLKKEARGKAGEVLDGILGGLELRKVADYDGTVLVYHVGDAVETPDPAEELAALPWPPPSRRALLARGLAGRVSFGVEFAGKSLADAPWRFRYCPLLAPWGGADSAVVRRPMLHVSLGRALDALLAGTGYRRLSWGGVVLLSPAGKAPGPEPSAEGCLFWRGEGMRDSAWLDGESDTGLERPGPAGVEELERALKATGRRLVLHDSARMERYRGIPAGRLPARDLFALLHRFDGLCFSWGGDWLVAWRGKEPEEVVERLKASSGSVVRVGSPLPEGKIFETRPFSELPAELAEELREMEADARLGRKVFVAFRRLSLKEAFLRLELRAYFHFEWPKELEKRMESVFVEGYFEGVPVREATEALCKAGGLGWRFLKPAPKPGNRDMRFVITLYAVR